VKENVHYECLTYIFCERTGIIGM